MRPGVLSAVEIDHRAGLVRLGLPGDRRDSFAWQVLDVRGTIAAEGRGSSFNVVLSPGRYRVLATAEKTFAGEFSVAAGESLELVLDP